MGAAQALRARIGLTGRALAFLVTGATLMAAGTYASVIPVVQFGALLAGVPLASAVLTRGPGSLGLGRSLSTREVATGDELHVTIDVRGRFALGRSLLLEDLTPRALGGPRRLALNGVAGQALARPHYTVYAGARGAHHLGPMRIHVVDRFGLVHRVTDAGAKDEVLVHPRVVPLDPVVLGGAAVGSGSGHLGAMGAASDDVIPRPYQPGDEMRRIDWKAVARTGNLMVRNEESPWRTAVTIVLDLHDASHFGTEPDSSIDAALTMAASIGCLALGGGWDVTVRTTDDELVFTGSPLTGVEAERRILLRALATVPTSHAPVPATSLQHTADWAARGPIVLVAGSLSPPAARVLAGIGRHSPQRLLLWVDAAGWQATGRPVGAAGSEAVALFQQSGWRVSRLARGADPAAAWTALGSGR